VAVETSTAQKSDLGSTSQMAHGTCQEGDALVLLRMRIFWKNSRRDIWGNIRTFGFFILSTIIKL
jgi:hypothetical protein